MEALLAAVEASPPGQWMRGAGVWSYAIANVAHILGIATLFGSVLALDLRMLGAWPSLPLRQVEAIAVPLSIAGFVLAAATGVLMLTVNATEYLDNPFLLIKFSAIGLALLNALLGRRLRVPLRVIGAISLVCWLTAISAGRMLGYW